MIDLKKLEKSYEGKAVPKALETVFNKGKLKEVLEKQDYQNDQKMRFSIDIETLPITDQKSTGRCWIFAGLNYLREEVNSKIMTKGFELSQNYVAFYDKLEKINFFLESVDDFLEGDVDDRTLQHLLTWGIQDGGQWQMFVNIVKKYGVVPKDAMPETVNSEQSWPINQLINVKLRRYAYLARKNKADKKKIKELKEEVLDECYTLLRATLGTPPKKFDFEYVDKDKKYHLDQNLDPHSFYEKYVGVNLDDYVSLINSPTEDKPFYEIFTVGYLGNVVEGNLIKHLNLPIEELKELVIKQLKDGKTVWFGADVGFDGTGKSGIYDDEKFNYDLLELSLDMDKAAMLDYRASAMGHAMTITGVNLINDKPNKWKIQNSWGDKVGKKGYYMMSDTWFDKYVYQAVVHKKHLTKKQLKALDGKLNHLKPWDPMGTLA